MNKAHQFDMLSRTVGEQLPDCVFYDYDEDLDRFVVIFYGTLDELATIPVRGDFIVNKQLISDACQIEIRPNHKDYEAEYHAYVVHNPLDKF